MIDFTNNNWDIYQNVNQAKIFILELLKKGQLSIMLGAGASWAFGLPGWDELVKRCCDGYISPTGNNEKDIDSLKSKLNHNDYILRVQECLYKKNNLSTNLLEDIELNFETANNNLLMALTSLIIGKTRSTVDKILNLNYDSIIEWYLKVNGIKTVVNYKEGIITGNCDVEIIHPHGYLPHKSLKYENSNSILFSRIENETFKQEKENYLKELMYYFFRTKCFISIGVSPKTLDNYISSYITHILSEYNKKNIKRVMPFGIALVKPNECNKELINNLRDFYGIIILEIEHEKIPHYLFNIAQNLVGVEVPYNTH